MGYLDAQLTFSDAQALTATAASTNIVDLGIQRNLFDGNPLVIAVSADVAADITTGDETYAIALQCDDNSAFGSPTTLTTTTVAAASLALGKRVLLPIPVGVNIERYIRLNYTLGGTTPSATLTAFLSPLDLIEKVSYYKDNSTISG